MYRIVTGVTSDVGVPLKYLVDFNNGLLPNLHQAIILTNGGDWLLVQTSETDCNTIWITICRFFIRENAFESVVF